MHNLFFVTMAGAGETSHYLKDNVSAERQRRVTLEEMNFAPGNRKLVKVVLPHL